MLALTIVAPDYGMAVTLRLGPPFGAGGGPMGVTADAWEDGKGGG